MGSWCHLFFLVLVLTILGAAVIVTSLSKRRPLGRVIVVGMRSNRLWLRAETLAIFLIVLGFAILMVINNR